MTDRDREAVTLPRPAVHPERRRPGRPATVNPALLPLLRGRWERPLAQQSDGLDGARGLAFALAL